MQNSANAILVVIPARGGSKGIPRKNLELLNNTPLIAFSILAARQSRLADRVVVSTEDSEIAVIARDWGAEVVQRPWDLATDDAPTDRVLEHVVTTLHETSAYVPDLVILLQPTSPLRPDGLVDACIERLLETGADSLLTVFEGATFFWRRRDAGLEANYDAVHRPRRQDIADEERIYLENGSVYVTRREILMKNHCRLAGTIEWFVMDPQYSLEIDTPKDLELAKAIMVSGRARDQSQNSL